MDELVKHILTKLENSNFKWAFPLVFLSISFVLFFLSFYYLESKEAFSVALIENAMVVAAMAFGLWLLVMAGEWKSIESNKMAIAMVQFFKKNKKAPASPKEIKAWILEQYPEYSSSSIMPSDYTTESKYQKPNNHVLEKEDGLYKLSALGEKVLKNLK